MLALSIILALSLAFASCANNSDSDDGGNPSPALPDNVGENPITKTIKLNKNNDNYSYLELKTDGTALEIYIDDHKNNAEETRSKFKYTYDADAKRIYMKVEKLAYGGDFYSEAVGKLLTYNEYLSKLDEDLTEKNMKQSIKEEYERNKDGDKFKENYPDCNSYEDYEKEILENIKAAGFDSLDAYAKYTKRFYENHCKSMFAGQITYSYKIEDGKLTLTEKFTGVKNLIGDSECEFNNNSSYVYIDCSWASIGIWENDSTYSYYPGSVDTDKKTISFESEDRKDVVNATYEENIAAGTVTIKFKDKEYVCEFEGEKYTQVE